MVVLLTEDDTKSIIICELCHRNRIYKATSCVKTLRKAKSDGWTFFWDRVKGRNIFVHLCPECIMFDYYLSRISKWIKLKVRIEGYFIILYGELMKFINR